MRRDLGCSMDYLINESMRHYARSRNYSMAATNTAQPELKVESPHRPPPLPEAPAAAPPRPSIYLMFNGQRHKIDKEKYIIGRGSQVTDLTIRDGNISRKHCAVVYRNGSYFIKDLGSTNGIEFDGNRVEHKRIEDGDVFYLCDYQIQFSFR
ncbi:FHA domain-containing protein [Myxococcota bacterium]|nr:FHA domain-containing protein [Myxococcota bacterium]MBU1433155.1 FHA domain-containing protein [Myxococcota bacterium]MBU1899322.1 FHA domain-containing protein [Myxococcota bacterium]